MSHSRFAACLCHVLATAVLACSVSAGDAPPANEDLRGALLALAQDPSPKQLPKIREAYVKLQWARLMGEASLPDADEMEDEYGVTIQSGNKSGKKKPGLNADEKEKIKTWLDAQPAFKERFLLALNPNEDDFAAAARVAYSLAEKFPKDWLAFEHLVIAFAVVWDEPRVIRNIMKYGVPELYKSNNWNVATPEESFGWYMKNQQRLCPWFKTTPWRLLTHLTAEGLELSERDWIATAHPFNINLGTVYSKIVYDDQKLVDNVGKLNGRPYTLENLKTYGGVCRDQAFYARAACRAAGMPAYFAVGQANSAGLHAWVGWIVKEGANYRLQSHGRYEYDKYFTATITDPQSGKRILDYLVAIEAKALSSDKTYDEADLLFRVWTESGADLPAPAKLNLLITALQKNPYHRRAWLAVGDATVAGELQASSAGKQWTYLNSMFKEYPDFIYSMLSRFSSMFKTAQERYTFYEAAAKIFVGLKRQDLVAKLRVEEIEMCVKENRKDLAAQVAMLACQECAGEGEQGAAIARKTVDLLREQKQIGAALKPVQFALSKMTKVRAGESNPHWITVARALVEVYKETGDVKKAESLEMDIDRVGGTKRR